MEAACPTCGGSGAGPGEVPDPEELAELIFEVLRLRISNEPGVVSNVCRECRERLEQIRTFVSRARAACLALRLLGKQITSDLERCDKETQIDSFSDQDDAFEDQIIQEHEIKQEPEDYDFEEPVPDCDAFLNDDSIHQIKIEPLTEDEALKFHREASCDEFKINNPISNISQETDVNRDDDDTNEEETTAKLNGHLESEAEEEEYLDEDFKPTEEELYMYTICSDRDQKGPGSCEVCGETFPCQVSLWSHMSLHNNLVEKCILCEKRFESRQKLKRHVILHHSYNELLHCSMCGKSIRNLTKVAIHKSSLEDSDIELCCTPCQEELNKKTSYQIQTDTQNEIVFFNKNNGEIIQCGRCNKTFDDIRDLYPHVTACDGQIPSMGDFGHSNDSSVVKNEFDDTTSLSPQIVLYSSKNEDSLDHSNGEEFNPKLNNGYKCPHCSQTFTNKYLLRIHAEDHDSIIRDYRCPICVFKFKRKDHLKRHLMNIHGFPEAKHKKEYLSIV